MTKFSKDCLEESVSDVYSSVAKNFPKLSESSIRPIKKLSIQKLSEIINR